MRATAAEGLRRVAASRPALVDRLAHDPWPSVRAAAAHALAGEGANATALLSALDDASPLTVREVIAALVETPGDSIGARLMSFAEDPRRNPELRSESVLAVAARCEYGMTERLARLFVSASDETLPPPEQAVGHAALAALARVDPARARATLARMQANAFAVAALERATRNACPSRPEH